MIFVCFVLTSITIHWASCVVLRIVDVYVCCFVLVVSGACVYVYCAKVVGMDLFV